MYNLGVHDTCVHIPQESHYDHPPSIEHDGSRSTALRLVFNAVAVREGAPAALVCNYQAAITALVHMVYIVVQVVEGRGGGAPVWRSCQPPGTFRRSGARLVEGPWGRSAARSSPHARRRHQSTPRPPQPGQPLRCPLSAHPRSNVSPLHYPPHATSNRCTRRHHHVYHAMPREWMRWTACVEVR